MLTKHHTRKHEPFTSTFQNSLEQQEDRPEKLIVAAESSGLDLIPFRLCSATPRMLNKHLVFLAWHTHQA